MHSDLAGCQAAIDASPRKEQGHHLQAAQRGPVAATKTGFSVFSGPSKPQHGDHGGLSDLCVKFFLVMEGTEALLVREGILARRQEVWE